MVPLSNVPWRPRGQASKATKVTCEMLQDRAIHEDQMIPRRQLRIKGILPVRICGVDFRGELFSEHSCTATISFAGASLLGVRTSLSTGSIIDLQYRNRQAPFRVVWTVPASPASERHIGLECLKPAKDFWPVTLPDKVDPTALENRLYYSRKGRRADRRFPVLGTAYVSKVGVDRKDPAKVGDISLSGCYLQTSRPYFVGYRLELRIDFGPQTQLQALGVVRVRYPQAGMGIEFTFMSNMYRRTLERLVAELTRSDAEKQGQQQRPVQYGRLTPY